MTKMTKEQKLKAVFGAAMPLVQGEPTVSTVDALLEAIQMTQEQALGIAVRLLQVSRLNLFTCEVE